MLFIPSDTVLNLCSMGTLFAFVLVCAGVLKLQMTPGAPRGKFRTPYLNAKWIFPIMLVVAGIRAKAGEGLADPGVPDRWKRGNRHAEALGKQGFDDAKADALLAAGDKGKRGGHGRAFPICSPARSARAAMVSEGLTAAEVGRTEASQM